jgi:hypothetical protein
MRRAVVALIAALALPAAAGAKEVTAVTVCGADACTRATDHASRDAFMHAGGVAEEAPGTPQRSYRLRVSVDEPGAGHVEDWIAYWLPDAGLLASRDESTGSLVFTGVDAPLADVLRRAARGHEARPPRRFVRHEPVARVVEVVEPPAPRPVAADTGGGAPSLAWAGVVGAVVLLGAAGVARVRRR